MHLECNKLFQINAVLLNFYSWNNSIIILKKSLFLEKKLFLKETIRTIINKWVPIIIEKQICILERFLKDHVTLKTGVTMLKIIYNSAPQE